MHNTILQNALEIHIEPNMQYCIILFSGQQIFVESRKLSSFIAFGKGIGGKPQNKDEHERPAVIKGEHRRGGLLLLRLCSKLNELLA